MLAFEYLTISVCQLTALSPSDSSPLAAAQSAAGQAAQRIVAICRGVGGHGAVGLEYRRYDFIHNLVEVLLLDAAETA